MLYCRLNSCFIEQFAIRVLVAYKTVAYKKNECIFVKSSTLDVGRSSEYASDKHLKPLTILANGSILDT